MNDLKGYDAWLSSPPEDDGLERYLQSMTMEDVLDVCGEYVIERMTEHYYDKKHDTP